jgi:hypothetical protein
MLLSEVIDVPTFSTASKNKSSTPPNPSLVAQLQQMRDCPKAIWCLLPRDPKDNVVTLARAFPPEDSFYYPAEAEFRRQMDKTRERAVYEQDELSVALVCYSALDCAHQRNEGIYLAFAPQMKEDRDKYFAEREKDCEVEGSASRRVRDHGAEVGGAARVGKDFNETYYRQDVRTSGSGPADSR